MQETQAMNKMGVEPVNRLMLKMGVPMIISMVLQALYNIVDSYFVSNMKDTSEITGMGEYAVNALTLAFPIQMLIVAVGVGTGVGINALLARSIGEGNRNKASKIAGNAIFLGLCTYIVFLLFGIVGVNAYLNSQTNDAIVLEMGRSYLGICTILSFGIILYTIYEKLLQATGRTTLTTIAQVAGAVTNMILDPIMIFGYFGFPQMGIKGAAYATVIGQMLSFILDALFHYKYNKDLDSKISYIKPDGEIIKEIYKVGLPAIIMQALMSFMTYGVNIIFGTVSTAAVTAYGVYYKIQQFIFFAAFGMNNAIIPIVSFNYGMRDKKRVDDGMKYGLFYTLIIMLVGLVGLQVFAIPLSNLFSLSKDTQKLCVLSIRIITIGYLFAGTNITYQGVFQALGYGVHSLIVSLLRLIVVVLPLAGVFAMLSNAETMIWISFPIAEAVAMVVAIFMMRKIARIELKEM